MKNNGDELRRVKRFAVVCLVLLLIYTMVVVGYFSWRVGAVEQLIATRKPEVVYGLNGQNGAVGPAGPQGPQGLPGLPGRSVTAPEIADAVVAYLEANPPQNGRDGLPGPKGDPGQSANQLLIKVDQDSCQLESQYQGDDSWTLLAQLPKPCVPTPEVQP